MKRIMYILSAVILFGFFLLPKSSFAESINSCKDLYRNLYFGSRGEDVRTVQFFLKDKGYFIYNPTGYFGYGTYNSLVRWQRSQGIYSNGRVGLQTRNRISQLCSDVVPVIIPDPVPNFVPNSSCKTWFDGCNECSRSTPGGASACTLRYCFAAGNGYCKSYFDSNSYNLSPVISSFSGPTTLTTGQTGTWTIIANDPENQQLTYNILWGDEYLYSSQNASASVSSNAFSQTTSFTHSYANAGTFNVNITVRDAFGNNAKSTSNVQVGNNTVCTMDYTPVCGQPPEPACRFMYPACLLPTPAPKTYSNTCVLNSAGANYLYNGVCNNGN
jgi:peptidoglycan hydrolase-like protein with peptidoglycan-binding domain